MTSPTDPDLPRWARRGAVAPELTDDQLAAFIGPRWEETYRRKLAPFRQDASFVPTWNWAAALPFLTPVWLVYRKLYLGLALYLVSSSVAFPLIAGTDATADPMALASNPRLLALMYSVVLSLSIAFGGSGNWLLYRRARAASRLVAAQAVPSAEALAMLRRIGGTSRGGATFILIVLVVLQLLPFLVPGVQP